MSTAAPVIGVVLAGGAGRRLGGAKATALLAGRPLLCYPLAALAAELDQVVVVAKRSSTLPELGPGIELWPEPEQPRHPLAGVLEALRRAGERAVLVVACDMPFVSAELIAELARTSAPPGALAVLACGPDGRAQPLCARYDPGALAALTGYDASGRATEQVLERTAAVLLATAGELLENVNDAGQLAAAEARLSRT